MSRGLASTPAGVWTLGKASWHSQQGTEKAWKAVTQSSSHPRCQLCWWADDQLSFDHSLWLSLKNSTSRRKEEISFSHLCYLIMIVLELSAKDWKLWSLDTTGQSPRKGKSYLNSTIQPKVLPKWRQRHSVLCSMSQGTWHTLKTSHLFLSSSSSITL